MQLEIRGRRYRRQLRSIRSLSDQITDPKSRRSLSLVIIETAIWKCFYYSGSGCSSYVVWTLFKSPGAVWR